MRTLARLAHGTLPLALLLAFGGCENVLQEREPPSIVLAAGNQTVVAGSTLQLAANVTEADGSASTRRVQWESNDPSIATVDASGRVTGVSAGTAVITASAGGTDAKVGIAVMRAPNPGGPQSTFLAYTSTPGDYIGGGQTVRHEVGSGTWSATVSPDRNQVTLNYGGMGGWQLSFAAPRGSALTVGTYENATRFPFQPATMPGLSFHGYGVGCNTLTGRFVIHDIAVDYAGKLHRLHATFRQHCEGMDPYLDGEVALLLNPLR